MNVNISIITAVLNASSSIRYCLDNVKGQTYQPKEHIIIDGGSTDNTVAVINEFGSAITKTFSEPDAGMYDAMNKGLKSATGDIVGILNADDYYANNRILEKVATVFQNPNVDACYGDLHYVKCDEEHKVVRYWRAGNFTVSDFDQGWMPPHPTFFVRRKIYEQYGGFKLDLGTSADYELMLRFLLKHRIKCSYIPETLVHMRSGGISCVSIKARLAANQMDRRAWAVNNLKPYPWTMCLKPLRKLGQWKTSLMLADEENLVSHL